VFGGALLNANDTPVNVASFWDVDIQQEAEYLADGWIAVRIRPSCRISFDSRAFLHDKISL
jgi:hypothetical protein